MVFISVPAVARREKAMASSATNTVSLQIVPRKASFASMSLRLAPISEDWK